MIANGRMPIWSTCMPCFRRCADPSLPESYQFARTDDYLTAIGGTGAKVVYRLGESIEHTRRKYHVAPPADYDKWTAACLGIIRHENEGWAGGAHRKIGYWEIWNEPDNRPAMWTGSDDDYFRLYVTAAKGIKAQFPGLMVGGPAAGGTGDVVHGELRPTAFLTGFLNACRTKSAPLDFFSWHTYSDDPHIFAVKARAIRRWLDEQGFRKTEIHLNEWNYLPGNEWGPLLVAGQGIPREKWYAEMGIARGAAFIAAVLVDLQDSPIDVANLYSGDSSPFGLFSRHGVPKTTFHAMKAFRKLLDTPRRIAATTSDGTTFATCAGINAEQSEISILTSNYRGKDRLLDVSVEKLPWPSRPTWKAFLVDDEHNLEPVEPISVDDSPLRLRFNLAAPGVLVIQLHRSLEETGTIRDK